MSKLVDFLTMATSSLLNIERHLEKKTKTLYPLALCDVSAGNVLDYRGRRHLLILSPTTFDMNFTGPGAASLTIPAKTWTEVFFDNETEFSTSGLGTAPGTLTTVLFLATDELAGL